MQLLYIYNFKILFVRNLVQSVSFANSKCYSTERGLWPEVGLTLTSWVLLRKFCICYKLRPLLNSQYLGWILFVWSKVESQSEKFDGTLSRISRELW